MDLTGFPVAKRGRGYHVGKVDAFIENARANLLFADGELTSADVRAAAFPLTKHGYDIASVDAALVELEEAFAKRERAAAIDLEGADAWASKTRAQGQEILDRVRRKRKHRFKRTGILTFGYRVAEVDALTDRIAAFLEHGEPLEADQLRDVAFRMQRKGYREAQVDALINATIEVVLAVR